VNNNQQSELTNNIIKTIEAATSNLNSQQMAIVCCALAESLIESAALNSGLESGYVISLISKRLKANNNS
jgi:hypothetical protein